jgi:hypothetical protein
VLCRRCNSRRMDWGTPPSRWTPAVGSPNAYVQAKAGHSQFDH